MIDTIQLTLPAHHFKVLNPALFQPNANLIRTTKKCVQNPTKEDEKNGVYKPRLTYTQVWNGKQEAYRLKIEFSIPKLLFGNNFDELSDDDFPRVVQTLKDALFDMGVEVSEEGLERATVSTIHYGKNIILNDYTSVSRVLSLINKTNISKRFDTNRTEYINGGELLRFHTNSFQMVLYDKIADLKQTRHRAVEKDMRGVNCPASFFEEKRKEAKARDQSFEVLRLEIRFMNSVKRKTVFDALNIPNGTPFAFRDAFCAEHARRIVEHHWKPIEAELKTLELSEMKPIDLLNRILREGGDKTPTKTLALVGLAATLSDNDNRTVRKQLEAKHGKRSIDRLYKELSGFQGKENIFTFVPIINEVLKIYRPLRI